MNHAGCAGTQRRTIVEIRPGWGADAPAGVPKSRHSVALKDEAIAPELTRIAAAHPNLRVRYQDVPGGLSGELTGRGRTVAVRNPMPDHFAAARGAADPLAATVRARDGAAKWGGGWPYQPGTRDYGADAAGAVLRRTA